MAELTIQQIIHVAKITQYLVTVQLQQGGLSGGGEDLLLPRKLYCIRKNVEYVYEKDPTESTLRGTANYLLSLCDRGRALRILANGGGTVVPVAPIARPARMDFYVSSSTYIATGASVVIMPTSWTGYSVDLYRGNLAQAEGVTDGASTYFTYDKATRTLTIIGAASQGELFSIIPYL